MEGVEAYFLLGVSGTGLRSTNRTPGSPVTPRAPRTPVAPDPVPLNMPMEAVQVSYLYRP